MLPWMMLSLALVCAGCATPRQTGGNHGEKTPEIETRISGVYLFAHPMDPADAAVYGELPPETLFYVHDGEWGIKNGKPVVVRGQSYRKAGKEPLVLVYHAEPEFLQAFAGLEAQDILDPLEGRIIDLLRRGFPVRGVQFDFDLGAEGLAVYPAFLKQARTRFPAELSLSVTALASTAGEPAWADLAPWVDEVCPMLYGWAPEHPAAPVTAEDAAALLEKVSHLKDKVVPVLPRGGPHPNLEPLLNVVRGQSLSRVLLFDLSPWEDS